MPANDSEAKDSSARPQNRLRLSLAPDLDLREAAALKDTLLAGLASGSPLIIDASAVNRMSAAAVQVLIAFIIATGKQAASVTIRDASPPFLAAFASLGLAGFLDRVTRA